MRLVGAPGQCKPHLRWGRRRGMMREKAHEGHYAHLVSGYAPAHIIDWRDLTGITGDTVTTWRARAGTSPTQGVAGRRPLVGRSSTGMPGALFDGADDSLDIAGGICAGQSQVTIVSVASESGAGNGAVVEQWAAVGYYNPPGGLLHGFSGGPFAGAHRINTQNYRVGTTALVPNTMICHASVHDITAAGAGEVALYRNGAVEGTGASLLNDNAGTFAAGTAYVGGGSTGTTPRPLGGYISALIAVHGALVAARAIRLSRLACWLCNAR